MKEKVRRLCHIFLFCILKLYSRVHILSVPPPFFFLFRAHILLLVVSFGKMGKEPRLFRPKELLGLSYINVSSALCCCFLSFPIFPRHLLNNYTRRSQKWLEKTYCNLQVTSGRRSWRTFSGWLVQFCMPVVVGFVVRPSPKRFVGAAGSAVSCQSRRYF